MTEDVLVYSDWQPGREPRRLGTLSTHGRSQERFAFAFDAAALADAEVAGVVLDPELRPFVGAHFPAQGRLRFGAFADASPDRWGRTLIKRRFERERRADLRLQTARLTEIDYLLGVHDAFRSGALRLKRTSDGPFLDDRHAMAAPPFVRLRELEAAARAIESTPDDGDPRIDAWLRLLIAPGASLGGARPKATVADSEGRLWIAKFPSVRDDHDVGAWERVVHVLAARCGLDVPESEARRFASDRHTFLVRRFDRTANGRVHFASAMTLTGRQDGDDASSGASYLEIAEALVTYGARTRRDLAELWSRLLFGALVSNADDHLRNHGFLLEPSHGWRLSPMYDVNPVAGAHESSLAIDETSNEFDLDLIRSVAPYFRLDARAVDARVRAFSSTVAAWQEVATGLGIARAEREAMAPAFALAATEAK